MTPGNPAYEHDRNQGAADVPPGTANGSGLEARDWPDLSRLLVESASEYAIFALDLAGNIISWNVGAQKIKGYTRVEVIGQNFSIFYTSEDRAKGHPAMELEIAEREGRYQEEGWRLRKDGRLFWARVTITALRDETGLLLGFGKVTQDLTSQRDAEEQSRRLAAERAAHQAELSRSLELTRLNTQLQANASELQTQTAEAQLLMRQLERVNQRLHDALHSAERSREESERAAALAAEANRAKSDFLAVMSHELRTPLNAIAGYAELVETEIYGPVTERQAEALSRIRHNQRYLLSLINDVLNFAKLEAGRVQLTLTTFSVERLFQHLDSMVMPQLNARDLRFVRNKPEPELKLHADFEKLTQILLNLLSNAIKFTDARGLIELEASGVEDGVMITVKDSGIGIESGKMHSVFEPFVQVSRELTSIHGGTGLGLAISRDLARLMGGDITLSSLPGEGSTFSVLLPRG